MNTSNPKDTQKPTTAGGLPSVVSTIKQLVKSKRAKANIKNLLRMNKAGGFDCPGCAWGDSTDSMLQFCENGAKAIAWESTERKVDANFFVQYSVRQLAKQSDYWLEYQGRITQPMRYNPHSDHYEPITWEQAFDVIADKINSLHDINELELYTSGRASNEAAYLYQLFGRSLGTNNFPDCSNMCHEASGLALKESIGVGKGTVVLDDFYHADAIFVFGQNPGSNHPRMMNVLRKAAKNNCKIVTINNLKEVALEKFASPQKPLELLNLEAVDISHLYITPLLGGDMALVRGMIKTVFESHQEAISDDFIKQHTAGYHAFKEVVATTNWQTIETLSGVNKRTIEQAANVFVKSTNVISTWAMGITQHKHSVPMIREFANLHLLLGKIGQKGSGLCPVRGHSNVQGNRTVGINEKPTQEFLNSLSSYFDIAMPKDDGHNVYQALKALHAKSSKVLIGLGGNLCAAAPDTHFTSQAIRNAELNVQISTKLNRTHLQVSKDALILPCLGRTELDTRVDTDGQERVQAISVEDTFSMVHASAGQTHPASSLCLSEVQIVANIAHATLGNTPVDWLDLADNYDRIRDHIANTIPGFEQYNEKLNQPGGFHLVNDAAKLVWNTKNGKANFSNAALATDDINEKSTYKPNSKRPFIFALQSMRSHDQYNTTIYGMDDRYRGISGKRNVLFINQDDALNLGFQEGEAVTIVSVYQDEKERRVDDFELVFYDIPSGNLAGYYPELNRLISIESVGDLSFTPISKHILVHIEKYDSLNIKVNTNKT